MIYFSAQNWFFPAIIIGAIFAGLIYLLFRKNPGIKTHARLGSILKFLAVCLILLCLVDPQSISKEPVKGATSFILMSDNSSSMSLKSKTEKKSNADRLTDVLKKGESNWLLKLKEDFDFHHYKFDRRIREISDQQALNFKGESTDIARHLNEVAERFDKEKTGGILLLTDGITTDKKHELNIEQLPPIYPVIIKSGKQNRDLEILDMSASVSAFEDAPVDLNIELAQKGFDEKSVTLELLDEEGKILESRQWQVKSDREIFRLQPKDAKAGIRFYKARVFETSSKAAFLRGESVDEISVANNSKLLRVDRRGGPYKVLYVSGRPNWEYKFLSRALIEDQQIQLRALIRLAKREEKFKFRPGRNNNVNPLFQALDDKEAQKGESFDEPVYMRINTEDEKELEKGFPNTPEELFKYHAIIIDDCEADFFTADQLSLLRDFVSIRGGGLLMMAGMESLHEGKYEETPLKELLPVYLNRPLQDELYDKRFKLSLTREGWLAPWVRLHSNETDEKKRLSAMPNFQVLNRISAIKPGAQLLANVKDSDDNEYPALVYQKFGLGRTSVFTVGDFWRWGMQNAQAREDMNKAWRQMMRWLTADVPPAMDLKITESTTAFEPVSVEFSPKNQAFQKMTGLKPIAKFIGKDGKIVEKTMAADQKEAGLYKTNFYPDQKGQYKVEVELGNAELPEGGKGKNAFNFTNNSPESQNLKVDEPYLKQLAVRTGGKLIEIDSINSFVHSIPEENFKVTVENSAPLWDSGWVLGLIILLLSSDWWLRRTRGMP